MSDEVPCHNKFQPLEREVKKEVQRVLLALSQQEGGGGPKGQQRGSQAARRLSSRSPPQQRREWEGDRTRPSSTHGHRDHQPRSNSEGRRPRSRSREQSPGGYHRTTGDFQRVGGHKRKGKRGVHRTSYHKGHQGYYQPK